jgi:hypothetical protein
VSRVADREVHGVAAELNRDLEPGVTGGTHDAGQRMIDHRGQDRDHVHRHRAVQARKRRTTGQVKVDAVGGGEAGLGHQQGGDARVGVVSGDVPAEAVVPHRVRKQVEQARSLVVGQRDVALRVERDHPP